MTVVLAIDQGTSATKAVVVAPDGQVLGLAEQPVQPRYRPHRAVEQDPQQLLDSVLTSGRAALAQAGRPADVVALANQGESVLAWDPDSGKPLSAVIVWQDRRAETVCAGLREHAPFIAHRTGLVLDPYFSAPKQTWLRWNVTRDGVVTTTDSWLLHQLTGEFVTDVTTASRSLITDLDTGAWDHELIDLFDLTDEPLPRIVACDDIIGETTAFGPAIPVGGLTVDQQAALVAHNCLAPGDTKCTLGTGAFLVANTGAVPVRSTASLATSVAARVAGKTTYCIDGQVYTAASAVRWLQHLGFINSAADLDRVAAPESDGVLAIPALAGLAAPWWRPDARASFTGMTLSTGPGHLVRATLDGIAAQIAELASLIVMDLNRPLTRLRVDGGLTRSRVLMQALADLMQIDIEVYPSQHATPLGAAALARTAVDRALPLHNAVVSWQPATTYRPRWSADRAAEFRHRWNAAIPAQ